MHYLYHSVYYVHTNTGKSQEPLGPGFSNGWGAKIMCEVPYGQGPGLRALEALKLLEKVLNALCAI